MGDFLAGIAPTVLSAMLGPFSGLAVAGLGKIFGIEGATQEKITQAITEGKVTPEQLGKLKELELQFKNDEAERGFKYAELEFKNVDSARTLRTATGSYFPEVLSTLITVGFFGILGWMMHDKAAIESQPLLIMLGSLGAAFGAVVNFWLGSNKGSDRTKELLAQATLKQ